MGIILSKFQDKAENVEQPEQMIVIEVPSNKESLKITTLETEAVGESIEDEEFAKPVPGLEEQHYSEEEEEYEKVNALLHCLYSIVLCCQPKAVYKYKLPQGYQQKDVIVVDFGSKQFNSKNQNIFMRLALFIKHHMEVYLNGFGFKNLQVKAHEIV